MPDHMPAKKRPTLRQRLGRLWQTLRGQQVNRDYSAFPGGYDSWRQLFVLPESEKHKRSKGQPKKNLSFHLLVSCQEELVGQDGQGDDCSAMAHSWGRTEVSWGSEIPESHSWDDPWTIIIDKSDILLPLAYQQISAAIEKNPKAHVFYGDEEFTNQDGRLEPFMKPQWSPELWESTDYLGILVVRSSLIKTKITIPNLVAEILGCQEDGQIIRIPHVLCQKKNRSGATGSKSRLTQISRFHQRRGCQGGNTHVISDSTLHVQHALPEHLPKVSIVIPSRDRKKLLAACVESLLRLTAYENFEIVLIDNDSQLDETRKWFQSIQTQEKVRVLSYPHPFNFAAINNFGAANSEGEILVFLNDDTTVIGPHWLTEMVRLAHRPDMGAIGALLYYPNDTIQHAGVVCGISKAHIAGHIDRGLPRSAPPVPAGVDCVHNYSVVTGACTALRRRVFEKVDGFDEQFSICYNDVDLCLRIQDAGFRNAWTPHAQLYHHENISVAERNETQARVYDFEAQLMRKRYGKRLLNDPAYNPNFALDGERRVLAAQPRLNS